MSVLSQEFIRRDLIVVGLKARDREAVLRTLGHLLYDQGYVKRGWAKAALAREKEYPTGLPTAEVRVALPHTDAVHCLKPGIAVATLTQPVQFIEMGSEDTVLDVEIVFCLSITNPEDQITWLQKLATVFQRPGILQRMKAAVDVDALYQVLRETIVDGKP